jgi:hypothetical protein
VGDYAFLGGFCVQHSTEYPLFRTDPFIETGVENARLHDLRRTGATHLTGEGLSVSRFLVSQVLNHISDTGGSSAVTAVYDRNAYLAQKRNALGAWVRQSVKLFAPLMRAPVQVFHNAEIEDAKSWIADD